MVPFILQYWNILHASLEPVISLMTSPFCPKLTTFKGTALHFDMFCFLFENCLIIIKSETIFILRRHSHSHRHRHKSYQEGLISLSHPTISVYLYMLLTLYLYKALNICQGNIYYIMPLVFNVCTVRFVYTKHG